MTNQPTDATHPQGHDRWCSYMLSHGDKSITCDCWLAVQPLQKQVIDLTAQLAVEQAKAKAWEAWANSLIDDLPPCISDDFSCDDIDCERCETVKNRPQPVDASSLARIARVALDGQKYVQATQLGDTYEEEERFEELHNSVDATTPNDIALAQALVGGA